MRKLIIAVYLGLAACSQPVEQTRTLDERPGILVAGAPAGAVLQVDGLIAGAVRGPGGTPQAIRVEPGTHAIAVLLNGASIMQDRVFVSGAMVKEVTVPGGQP